MTWGEFQDCLEGFNQKLDYERQFQDALNHTLGRYIGIAVNNPKKYPKEPYLAEERKRENITAHTDEERIRIARIKYMRK